MANLSRHKKFWLILLNHSWWNKKVFCRSTPGVNFTNILWAAFAPKSFRQKITNPNCKHIKAAQKIFYEKAAHKILVKLTPWRHILLTAEDKGKVADGWVVVEEDSGQGNERGRGEGLQLWSMLINIFTAVSYDFSL
jgi:hypothetical protein